MRDELELKIDGAVGGEYRMPDGREFWIDGPVAREIARRAADAIKSGSDTELFDAAKEAADTMDFARVFVTSRQRIKKPEGEDMYDEHLARLQKAVSRHNT